jgi:uncharacterized protein YjiK
MNKLFSAFIFLVLFGSLISACQKPAGDKLVGKWRVATVEFQRTKQQKEFLDRQVAMFNDSIAATTDTAKINRFNEMIAMAKTQAQQMQEQQDTMKEKSRWEFKANGDFNATEMGGENSGIWSYDEGHSMLFTVINEQTASVDVKFKGDTLLLMFDSLNYLGFVKTTE